MLNPYLFQIWIGEFNHLINTLPWYGNTFGGRIWSPPESWGEGTLALRSENPGWYWQFWVQWFYVGIYTCIWIYVFFFFPSFELVIKAANVNCFPNNLKLLQCKIKASANMRIRNCIYIFILFPKSIDMWFDIRWIDGSNGKEDNNNVKHWHFILLCSMMSKTWGWSFTRDWFNEWNI